MSFQSSRGSRAQDSLGGPLETLTVSRIGHFSPLEPLSAGLWGPRRPPGRLLGPKTPSRQASGTQDALPAGLWGPRRPPGKSPGAQDALPAGHLGPQTLSWQVPWNPRRPSNQALCAQEVLLTHLLRSKTPSGRPQRSPDRSPGTQDVLKTTRSLPRSKFAGKLTDTSFRIRSALRPVPLHTVDDYRRVHASIYIYIYIYIHT